MYFSWVLLLAVPPALVALAVWLERRSWRGYGLGLLAAALLALEVWGIIAFSHAAQRVSASHTDNLTSRSSKPSTSSSASIAR